MKVVYKHFVVHPGTATAPARAACAAGKQGKFKEMYNMIWQEGYDKYRAEKDPKKMGAENMRAIATNLQLDMGKYDADLKLCATEVAKDESQMRKVGISGTPGFFINGRYLRGAQPLAKFKQVIDEELKKANDRIGKGEATAANYYKKFVAEKGKKSL